MNAQTEKAGRRKRKSPQRRVPTIIEQREQKPFIFGWGSDLNHREREALKERIALFAGIGLAVLLACLLGWGWYQDNVATPAAVRAQNNQQVAQVGTYTVRMGFFKRFEKFQQSQLNTRLTQIQQQLQALQADTAHAKQNAAQIAQLQAQQGTTQQQLGSLASDALTGLIENQTILQRSYLIGIPVTTKLQDAALRQVQTQLGGPVHLAQFINSAGLTLPEFKMLVTSEYLIPKVANKLAASVSRYQVKVRASHILIPTKQKALAQQLLQRVLHGANFAALAKKYSTDPGSAKKGGDLGYFAQGAMVAPFDKAAFSMTVGQIRMVQSAYGWHIIKLTGREHARLTNTEFSQAKQNAFSTWISRQQALIHVQRFVAPQNLPNPVSTPTTAGLTSQLPAAQVPAPVAPSVPRSSVKLSPAHKGSTAKKP